MNICPFRKFKEPKARQLGVQNAILIHFSDLEYWQGRLPELAKEIEKRSRAAARGAEQWATNSDIFIINSYGKATLTALFWEKSISLWNYHTGAAIGDYSDIPLDLPIIIENVSNDLHYCSHCKGWFLPQFMRSYSFAGTVCIHCYDPKRHLPPDTRGD